MEKKQTKIPIATKRSLIHLGSLDSFDITEGGKKAGRLILAYLDKKDTDALYEAVRTYDALIPNENFGGEYTALEWICKLWLAPPAEQERLLAPAPVRSFYEYLKEDGFERLKWYINRKYHFIEIGRKDFEAKAQLRFLEDFILFGNPDRERWEKIRENMQKLPIRPGDTIADVGAGPGYYSFKFADLVGKDGKIYAIETNPKHLDYLRKYVADNHIQNVEVVKSSFEGIGLAPDIRVDAVFICSLYHNVYAAFTDKERDSFIASIRRALKPNGFFMIVDNDLVEDHELPYHGPYIAKELLLSQLYYYGFSLEKQYQFTPQRYVLILRKEEEIPQADASLAAVAESPGILHVLGASSLVRYRIIGTSTSGFTWNGKRMALELEAGLSGHDRSMIGHVAREYEKFMKIERIGDEYTALLWFCQMYLMPEKERGKVLEDPLERDYYEFFSENDFYVLKTYLRNKYNLKEALPEEETEGTMETDGTDVPLGQINEWSEYLTFNNPNRYLWEHTQEMLEWIAVRKGEAVADIGCGSGYFSWQFSRAVGPDGVVYAVEVNEEALSYVKKLSGAYDTRIIPRLAALNDVGLAENSVDTMFLCSMYHAVYIASIEMVKDSFIRSMQKGLRPDGRLYIVDNSIAPGNEPAYFGPGIAKELVIAQLEQYGFVFEDMRQFVPQRYVLRFRNQKR